MTLNIAKKRWHLRKDKAFMVMSVFSRLSFRSKDKGTSECFTAPGAPNNPTSSSNPKPSLAVFQIPKYTKDDLQRIFRTVLESQSFITCGQDHEISKNCPEQVFKARVPNVYKDKSHINYYNFIQQYKNHLPCLGLGAATEFFLPQF